MNSVTKQTVDEREASQYVGFSQSYLRNARWRNDGPPYIRVGRAVRYRVEDLQRFLDEHRVETRSGGR